MMPNTGSSLVVRMKHGPAAPSTLPSPSIESVCTNTTRSSMISLSAGVLTSTLPSESLQTSAETFTWTGGRSPVMICSQRWRAAWNASYCAGVSGSMKRRSMQYCAQPHTLIVIGCNDACRTMSRFSTSPGPSVHVTLAMPFEFVDTLAELTLPPPAATSNVTTAPVIAAPAGVVRRTEAVTVVPGDAAPGCVPVCSIFAAVGGSDGESPHATMTAQTATGTQRLSSRFMLHSHHG